MNFLIVTQYFWPERFRINDLACALQEKGHTVTVLTGMPNYPDGKLFEGYHFLRPRQQQYENIKIWRVPLWPRGKGKSWELVLNYVSFVLSGILLAPWYCKNDYDLIFVFQTSPITVALPAILLKKLHKKPLIMWVQDLWPESLVAVKAITSPKLLHGVEKLVRFIYKNCDHLMVQSQAFINKISAQQQPHEKISYFPNWAESSYFPVEKKNVNAEIRQQIPSGFVVMFAGNLGVAQSLETIVAAAKTLRDFPDIHWVILGDGRQRAEFLAAIKQEKLENQMHWLGQKPVAQMSDYFAMADALLVTLRQDPIFELTIPSKIQSYLACGKPIVAALDGEGARVINEANVGIAVSAENSEALAQAVFTLYQMSEQQRQELGKQGLGYYHSQFEREQLITQFIQQCETVVRGNYASNNTI